MCSIDSSNAPGVRVEPVNHMSAWPSRAKKEALTNGILSTQRPASGWYVLMLKIFTLLLWRFMWPSHVKRLRIWLYLPRQMEKWVTWTSTNRFPGGHMADYLKSQLKQGASAKMAAFKMWIYIKVLCSENGNLSACPQYWPIPVLPRERQTALGSVSILSGTGQKFFNTLV